MNTKMHSNLGSICAILIGITYIIIAISFFLLPDEQQSTTGKHFGHYLESLAENSLIFKIQMWGFALGSMFGIAVVLKITDIIKIINKEWARWSNIIGIVGFLLSKYVFNLEDIKALMITISVALSMFIGATFSALTGAIMPVILDRLGIDPARAAGPFVTTINDLSGTFIYLATAFGLLSIFNI